MKPNQEVRVVVTGLGTINPLGHTINDFWNALITGCSGIRKVSRFDVSELPTQIAGEVVGFDVSHYMDAKEAGHTDPCTQFALAASQLAFEDAQLHIPDAESDRCGVIIGTGIGGMRSIQEHSFTLFSKGCKRLSPFTIPSVICNIASGKVAIALKLRGPNFGAVSACASGTHAIGEAFHWLKTGAVDVMLAGGSEASIEPLGFCGFCSMKAMSTHFNDCPEKASRPFDAKRDGFVMGEGAGILVLETLEHAQKRGAKIYGELCAYSASCDAFHITRPEPSGRALIHCFRSVLDNSNTQPAAVDYINAHGTSTYYNDLLETTAIKAVFGDHTQKLNISSTKSMTGHLLGAAGGVEAIVTVKAIETGIIPPTINYENADPQCDLNYTPNKAVKRPVKVAISDNLGFGGQNGALLFKAFSD